MKNQMLKVTLGNALIGALLYLVFPYYWGMKHPNDVSGLHWLGVEWAAIFVLIPGVVAILELVFPYKN